MDENVSVRGALGSQQLAIEPPRPADLPNIRKLAQELHLDENAWRSLMAAKNVVCAKALGGMLAGLYVANHYPLAYTGDELHELRSGLNVFINRFKVADSSVAFGAQPVIAPDWQTGELRGHLLRALLRSVGLRYRHLFSFCRKDNPIELHALQAEGWRCYQEEDETCYMVMDVAKVLRGLASTLVLRLPVKSILGGSPASPTGTRTA